MLHHLMRRGRLLLLGALVLPVTGAAQRTPRLTLGVTFAGLHSSALVSGSRILEEGSALGSSARFGVGKVSLELNYAEGSLHPAGSAADRAFVEGGGGASVRLTDWLSLGGSVRIHRVAESAPERWVTWGARAGVDLPIVGPLLRGHAAIAQGVNSEVNLPAGDVRAKWGEVGASLTLPRSPFALDLTAHVEGYDAGSQHRTLQHLALTLEWRMP